MLKLGAVQTKQFKKAISFKEWLKLWKEKPSEGKFLITYIGAPNAFPTAFIIFQTEEYNVKYSLSPEAWDAFKKSYSLKAQDIIGREFYFIINANGEYGIESYSFQSDVYEAIYEFNKAKKAWKHHYKAKAPEEEDSVEI